MVNEYDAKLSCPKPERHILFGKFNTCLHLYFLDIMLKFEPDKAFIVTEAWPQLCIHSCFPRTMVLSVAFCTKPFVIVSKFCNMEIGIGVLAPPLGRTVLQSNLDHSLL